MISILEISGISYFWIVHTLVAWLCWVGALWAQCWSMAWSATLEWPGLLCYGWKGFNIEEYGMIWESCVRESPRWHSTSGRKIGVPESGGIFLSTWPFLEEETRDPKRAEYGSLYFGLFWCFTTEYSFIWAITRHELPALLATYFVDDQMEKALFGVETSMYSRTVDGDIQVCYTDGFFYTNGSLIDGFTGFDIHRTWRVTISHPVRLVLLCL
jgi:hypothetical protein